MKRKKKHVRFVLSKSKSFIGKTNNSSSHTDDVDVKGANVTIVTTSFRHFHFSNRNVIKMPFYK